MQEIAQNFPLFAVALTKIKVDQDLKKTVGSHSHGLKPGQNAVTVNGIPLNAEEADIFDLHRLLQTEASTREQLLNAFISPAKINDLLSLKRDDPFANLRPGQDAFAAFRVNMDENNAQANGVVAWINDIENDHRYRQWPASYQELLRPAYPNELRYIRKNMVNMIIVVDPSSKLGLSFFAQALYFVKANAPCRVGVSFLLPDAPAGAGGAPEWPSSVLEDETDGEVHAEWQELRSAAGFPADASTEEEGEAAGDASEPVAVSIAKLFYYLVENANEERGWQFLSKLAELDKDVSSLKAVRKAFKSAANEMRGGKSDKAITAFESILTAREWNQRVQATRDYTSARGFAAHAYPCMVTNGIIARQEPGASFREMMMNAILSETQTFVMKVYRGEVNDNTNIPDHVHAESTTVNRLSRHVLDSLGPGALYASEMPKQAHSEDARLAYLEAPSQVGSVKGVTFWIVGDFDAENGLLAAAAAVSHLDQLKSSSAYSPRVAFLHTGASNSLTATLLVSAARILPASAATQLLRKALAVATYSAAVGHASVSSSSEFLRASFEKLVNDCASCSDKKKHTLLERLGDASSLDQGLPGDFTVLSLGLQPGASAVVVNGRVVQLPAGLSQEMLEYDFELLDMFEYSSKSAKNILQVLETADVVGVDADDITSDLRSDMVMLASRTLSLRYLRIAAGATAVFIPPANGMAGVYRSESKNSALEVRAVVDPLSKGAQRLAPVLAALRDHFKADLTMWLNPQDSITEFPLKRFYRYTFSTQPRFEDGQVLETSGALFRKLSTDKTLTLGMHTPESWLVSPTSALYDLDNLRLGDLPDSLDTVNAIFTLESLLVAGQCFDQTQSQPPAGLQLELRDNVHGAVADTVVMQNLGYFQLQANPGVWDLKFASERAATIFEPSSTQTTQFAVSSFNDPMRRFLIKRRAGMEAAPIADEQEVRQGYFGNLFNAQKKQGDTIHVFSIASGHLYERFLKIMMLSVYKNTDSPVKFWFIANFLSPQFKEFAPKMAAEYGYEVEFVTYKWPVWLRRQEEKQRVIWGYKILFLDVLFPLNLKRVIYVDADQIVRGDLKTLWDMDLEGAPYAYTPFCDSNKETEGFRFWKQGYWNDHLRGKPYHISALYVVDLERFRAMRAGDSLRMMYDNLSADKNSLANLDQDLPNYAQHMVPIFSLPQEWLWCQTWCSMDTLGDAMTIDLCNNPLTKTPKLDVARALVPEWTALDEEANSLSFDTAEPETGDTVTGGAKAPHTHDEL